MKHIKLFALVLFMAPAFLTFTGCDDDTPPPPEDTTDNTVKILNSFELGNERYEVETNASLTGSVYDSRIDQTTVTITGVSKKKAGTNIQDGDVIVQIKFPGKIAAEYEQARLHDVTLEISIKENNKPVIAYGTSNDSDLKFDIFEYGDVGMVVKGTFTGKVKAGSSVPVKNGLFEVIREDDI